MYKFEILKNTSKGRKTRITTPHGSIETPAFTFCATKAALRGCHSHEKNNTQLIIVNTYHLLKNSEKINHLGGIHKFMNWNGPIISDSGGYQVFSMGHGSVSDEIKGKRNRTKNLVKINENGVQFKCPITGDLLFLSPEKSMEIQHNLGVDFAVSFDECTPFNTTYQYTKNSLTLSNKWGLQSIAKMNELNRVCNTNTQIYLVLQGGIYKDLRQQAASFINENQSFGIAIGGCLGNNKQQMYDIVDFSWNHITQERPIHLLGIGEISDIVNLYKYVDTFDCVIPTRLARHGTALTGSFSEIFNNSNSTEYKINLHNARFSLDSQPIDPHCTCITCLNYSRAYIHHLIKNHELNYISALSTHNIHFMNEFFKYIRNKI